MLRLACGVLACSACVAPWAGVSPFDRPVVALACSVTLAVAGLVAHRFFAEPPPWDVLERVGAALCALALVGVALSLVFVARFAVALD